MEEAMADQQQDNGAQGQPAQKNKQHHDPRGHGGDGAGLAGQTPTGGASQDGFGQSGGHGTPDAIDHNARPGG
jgi:hypothetical protein